MALYIFYLDLSEQNILSTLCENLSSRGLRMFILFNIWSIWQILTSFEKVILSLPTLVSFAVAKN